MVFGSRRDQRPESLSREDVVGNLYPDSLTSEVDVTTGNEIRGDRGNESVIDPHASFNGKYVSDRDLRIEGEAQGEIECQGTLIISPQARVRSAITAHNVIVNGDYEGDVDCGGRFEIGATGRVKGTVKTQVLVVKEGAHWEGSVTMTREPGRPVAIPSQGSRPGAASHAAGGRQHEQPAAVAAGGGPSIFSKQDRDEGSSGERSSGERERSSGERQPTGPGSE